MSADRCLGIGAQTRLGPLQSFARQQTHVGKLDDVAGIDRPAAEATDVVFRVEGLSKIYRTGEIEVHALRHVDFTADAGEFVVLLGPSGSGKSTFLNIIGGLDRPTTGTVWFKGEVLTEKSDRALTRYRRDHVGFVFQFYNLVPSLTARENVALVTDIARAPMRPEEALEVVGLGARLDHFPAQLSGGEQQRVAIARAIAKRPEVLLCDEPTGALDSTTGVAVLSALTSVNEAFGTTTLVITHNVSIEAIAHRVVRFADGTIASVAFNDTRLAPEEVTW
ncbi:MAG: ABC transporter ATP-binding protein [Devosia sp.]